MTWRCLTSNLRLPKMADLCNIPGIGGSQSLALGPWLPILSSQSLGQSLRTHNQRATTIKISQCFGSLAPMLFRTTVRGGQILKTSFPRADTYRFPHFGIPDIRIRDCQISGNHSFKFAWLQMVNASMLANIYTATCRETQDQF